MIIAFPIKTSAKSSNLYNANNASISIHKKFSKKYPENENNEEAVTESILERCKLLHDAVKFYRRFYPFALKQQKKIKILMLHKR
jgi:hypothetical protein